MLIDWFTVGAQALNFAVLAWLMKRFLYRPILDAIDAREKRIAGELADAWSRQAEAGKERDELRLKNEAFDRQRARLLMQANADADAQRVKLLEAARAAADAFTAKRWASIDGEAAAMGQALRDRTQTEVFAIARKTLADLATVDLEASACEAFVVRLRALEGRPRDELARSLGQGTDTVIVRSAFELPSAQRRAIREAIADTFGVEPELHYETEPTLVSGIELIAQGRKFGWTISEHLASLERGVRELLKARSAASAPAPSPFVGPLPRDASAGPIPAGAAGGPIAVATAP